MFFHMALFMAAARVAKSGGKTVVVFETQKRFCKFAPVVFQYLLDHRREVAKPEPDRHPADVGEDVHQAFRQALHVFPLNSCR